MDKKALKQEIYDLVDRMDNKEMLSAYREVMEAELNRKGDFWNELSVSQKASVKRGMDQLKRGEGFSDAEVQKEIKARYNL